MKKMIVSSTLILSMTAFIINFCACGNKAEDTTAPSQPITQESTEQKSESIGNQEATRGMNAGQVVELSSEEQLNQLLAEGNAVVDFYAVWCPPCKALAPVLHDLANENAHITFVKVNTESFPSLSTKYNIKSLPTLIFFKNGQKIRSSKGSQSKKDLQATLNSVFTR